MCARGRTLPGYVQEEVAGLLAVAGEIDADQPVIHCLGVDRRRDRVAVGVRSGYSGGAFSGGGSGHDE